MEPWIKDARTSIQHTKDLDESLIEKTVEIERFLGKSNIPFIVIATKGLGKSLLLIAKRKKIEDENIAWCIPKNHLLDTPDKNELEGLSNTVKSLLKDKGAMCLLWLLSMVITIIKRVGMADKILDEHKKGIFEMKDISKIVVELLNRGSINTVSNHLIKLLRSIERKELNKLSNDYRILMPVIRSIDRRIAIFIDNIDECIDYLNLNRDIWYIAQKSLIEVRYE